jgi:hypothetical protein
MKKLYCIITGFLLFNTFNLKAQIELDSVVLKKGTLDEELSDMVVRYYFYPNLDTYFDIKTSQYIFKQNGEWLKSNYLATNFRGYSLYNNFRVEISDYKGDKPYEFLKEHREKYPCDYRSVGFQKLKGKNFSIFEKLNKKYD